MLVSRLQISFIIASQTATPQPCAVAPQSALTLSVPTEVHITRGSAENFVRYNHDGNGSLLVIVNEDGTTKPLVPPTKDIDGELRSTLVDFAKHVSISPTVMCTNAAAILLVRFDVPSGRIRWTPLTQAPKPSPTTSP